MAYTAEQKTEALAILLQNGNAINDASIAAVRDALGVSVSQRTLYNWLQADALQNAILEPIAPVKVASPVANGKWTDLQRQFAENYFIHNLNGTEAALATFDTTDRVTAASMAYEYLRLPHIAAYVTERLAEYHLSANEVLARLSFMACGSMEDFIDADSMSIDLKRAKAAKKLGLVKKLRTKFTTFTDKDGNESETTEIELELYDAQSALVHVGKHLGLFSADTTINLNMLSTEQLEQLAAGKAVRTVTIEAQK